MRLPNRIQIGVIESTNEGLSRILPLLKLVEEDINSFILKNNKHIKFDFIACTANGQASKALELLKSFKVKGVNLIIGPSWSSHISSCLEYANSNNMILFSSSSTSPLLSIIDDALFRLSPDDTTQALPISEMLISKGIDSVVVLRRDDAWSDGIFDKFKSLWKNKGLTLKDIRYNANLSDTSLYLKDAEKWIIEAISIQGKNRVGVLCLSFSEIVEILRVLKDYPNLFSVEWFGSDGTALLQEIVQKTPKQANKIKLYSVLASPSDTVNFIELYDRYYKITNKPLGFYTATFYDICWIYVLSIIVSNTVNPTVIREIIPYICETYLGVSGFCRLNNAGDRYNCDYQIWGYEEEKNELKPIVFGKYDSISQYIFWEKNHIKTSYNLFEKNQHSSEIDIGRKGIPLYESLLVEFKEEMPDNKNIAKLLVSLANTKGGTIYLGVTDKGDIIGISNIEENREKISNIARDGCQPPLAPLLDIVEVNGCVVIVVHITESDGVHRTSDGRYYNRVDSRTCEMSIDELRKLFFKRYNL